MENNTNLRKKTKLDKNWCSAKSPDQIYISGKDCKKHQNRTNGYIGSNDVLYWYYNSQQVSQGKTGIYLWMFGIFTFLAPLWQHLFWLLISILSQPSWTVWVDTEIRELEKKHCTYLSFGLSFEFWDMNKPDSKFFCPDPESERLTFNKKNTSSSAEC